MGYQPHTGFRPRFTRRRSNPGIWIAVVAAAGMIVITVGFWLIRHDEFAFQRANSSQRMTDAKTSNHHDSSDHVESITKNQQQEGRPHATSNVLNNSSNAAEDLPSRVQTSFSPAKLQPTKSSFTKSVANQHPALNDGKSQNAGFQISTNYTFPLSWNRLYQYFGRPGQPGVREFIYKGKKKVVVESGLSTIAVIQEYGNGFLVAFGDSFIVGDFFTRSWFDRDESDMLIELYSEYLVSRDSSPTERVKVGRYLVHMRRDPDMPGVVLEPLE